jgi:hypothetical protein
MIIYLKHPVHGTKIASMDLEAEFDESNGWVRYNPEEPDNVETLAPVNELQARRRGRPPKIAN